MYQHIFKSHYLYLLLQTVSCGVAPKSIPLGYDLLSSEYHTLNTLTMGSKLSCCFRVRKTPPAAEQELEALRDIQMEVDCTTAINFPPPNSHFKYVLHAWLKPRGISAKVSFVKNPPQQVSRRQPPPPLVVVCPPPSPRLPNVHGEEELDFRNSSTLCLWSLDPRKSGHEESGIPVEVNWCP